MTIKKLRVIRGRDWVWGDEDGGEGCSGTVLGYYHESQLLLRLTPSTKLNMPCAERELSSAAQCIPDENLTSSHKAGIIAIVLWDSGSKGEYRAGYQGAYDLQVFKSYMFLLLSSLP